jgi:hypothetical protein
MRTRIVIIAVLAILAVYVTQQNNEEEETLPNKVIGASDENIEAWKEIQGRYAVVYLDGSSVDEFYTLNEDGTCSWTFMGSYKTGNYRKNESGILIISVEGNTGMVEEFYKEDEYGRWSKGSAYLKRIN